MGEAAAKLGICVLLPFYNNKNSVGEVITSLAESGYKIIAVDDGSDDGSLEIVTKLRDAVPETIVGLVSYRKNKGKGYALTQGFYHAWRMGFRYALTFDADGQHTVSSADALIQAASEMSSQELEGSILIGSRAKRGKDSSSRFANNFSNFWMMVQTLRKLPDTQSGCRLYPLSEVGVKHYFSTRYEFEIEVLVRGAWNGLNLVPVPIEVVYEQAERVSHFRPGKDFLRITCLNVLLTLLSPIYGYPKIVINKLQGEGRKSV